MNASTWKKAADIVAKTTSVTLQASAAATVESHNLQSLQLSTLSIDDSGPLQVTYEPQQSIAMSTRRATDNSDTHRSISSDTTRYDFSIIPHLGS